MAVVARRKSVLSSPRHGNTFPISGPLWGESIGHRWIPLTQASDEGLWCSYYCGSQPAVEQTVDLSTMCDAMALTMIMEDHQIILLPYINLDHCSDKWASWHLKSPAPRLFVQQFVQADINGNLKTPHRRSFGRGFPPQRASNAGSVSMPWRHHVQ